MKKRIVYIHGLNSSPMSFSYISTQLPDHGALFVSYKSHQPLSASIQEVLNQLPKDQTFILVGHSLGGVIAAIIAAEFPHLVEKLIAIASPFKGSRAASTLRWIPGSMQVFNDLVPRAPIIQRCGQLKLEVPTLSIITIGGNLQTSPEPNDSVVAVSSQRGLNFGKQVHVDASHFEVLLSGTAVGIIKDFIFGEDDD